MQHQSSGSIVFVDGLARSETIPCVRTGRRHRALPNKDQAISVNVFFTESQDTMVLHVHPNMRIGPVEEEDNHNRFTDVFGDMASTRFCERGKNKFNFGAPAGGRWDPSQTIRAQLNMKRQAQHVESLKEKIENLAGIAICRQRLMYRQVPITMNWKTLRDYGIGHGQTVQCQIGRPPAEERKKLAAQESLFLACTERRRLQAERQTNQDLSPPRAHFDLRKAPAAHIPTNKSRGEFWLMPKWHSQAYPSKSEHGEGKTVGISVQEFGSMPIAFKDYSHHSYGPGGNRVDYIRAGPVFKQRLRI